MLANETRYRETKVNTTASISNVREVRRNITRDPDGTVKTFEHETVKEQTFVQQEAISREIEHAKLLYQAKMESRFIGLMKKWQIPRLLKHKYFALRMKQFRDHLTNHTGDLPEMKTHQSLQEVIAQQQAYIKYTCEDFEQHTSWLSGIDASTIVDVVMSNCKKSRGFVDNARENNFGSVYLMIAVYALSAQKETKDLYSRITERIAQEEVGQACIEVNGVTVRKTAPLYPFTPHEVELMTSTAQIHTTGQVPIQFYEEYLLSAFESKGKDVSLLVPVLEQCITALMLLYKVPSSPISHMALPDIVAITNVVLRAYDSFPFAPIDFWGSTTANEEYFACCQVDIGEDEVFDEVWLEIPLLIQTPHYTKLASAAFLQFSTGHVEDTLSKLTEPHQLFNLDPDCAEFYTLKQMYCEVENTKTEREETIRLSSLNEQLTNTVAGIRRAANMT